MPDRNTHNDLHADAQNPSRSRSAVSYRRRVERVVRYIHDHLDDAELDLNRLAEIACLSPYHWHRVYHALTGETVSATVRRLRLQRAADQLAYGDAPVAAIAKRCGYPNVTSFTRVFKAAYGLPPARYRDAGAHTRYDPERHVFEDITAMHDVNIITLEKNMNAVGLDHKGAYNEIGNTFDALFAALAAQRLPLDGLRTVAMYYDDPNAVPTAELRARAAVLVDKPDVAQPPLLATPLPAGRYAVLRHKGPYTDLQAAYNWFYGEWLSQSGHTPGDAPPFEAYLNSPQDVAPTELLTDIHMPLAA